MKLVIATLFVLLSPAAFAQAVSITDTVAGHGSATYFDLLKQVIPDLALGDDGATGHLPDGIVHVEGADATGEAPEALAIDTINVETVKSGGEEMLWLLADIGPGGNLGTYTLLAVFDSATTPKVVDVKEVDVLDFAGFVGTPFSIGSDSEAMMVGSEHFNSSQTYEQRTLLQIFERKLQVIASFSLYGTRSCDEWTTEELTVGADESYTDYWTIEATILRNKALAGQDCEDPLDSDWRHREFMAQYVWDSSERHYVPARNDFEELAKMDEILY